MLNIITDFICTNCYVTLCGNAHAVVQVWSNLKPNTVLKTSQL